MKRSTKRKSKVSKREDTKPKLIPGTVIEHTCLVVDERGVAYWVSPEMSTCKKVFA